MRAKSAKESFVKCQLFMDTVISIPFRLQRIAKRRHISNSYVSSHAEGLSQYGPLKWLAGKS